MTGMNNRTTERDDRFSRYLKGQMNAHEESLFLSDMESDKVLREDAITQARIVRGMRQVDDEIIHALKQASESDIKSSIRPLRVRVKKSVMWSLSVAASLAILIFAGYKGYDYYDTTQLGMKYATVFPMGTIMRGDTDATVESELETLFQNVVERKNLSATTAQLATLWQLANQDSYNDYTDYAPYIGWYLAIGYLENYEKDKAAMVLKSLIDKTKYPIVVSDSAKQLLQQIS